jgi:hypothetical protein
MKVRIVSPTSNCSALDIALDWYISRNVCLHFFIEAASLATSFTGVNTILRNFMVVIAL